MLRKAPSGFGSIRKVSKGGRIYFEGRYTDPLLHKQKSVSGRTEREVREKLKNIFAQIQTGQYVTPRKQTVGAWLDEWLATRENLEPSTRELYERDIRLYLKPLLGNIRLQDLRFQHCQDAVHQLLHDPKREKQLSPKSVRNAMGVLSKSLSTAVQAQLIASNPASNLEFPRTEKPAPKVMQDTEQQRFLEAIRGNPYERVFIFGLHTGARISEILGLQWTNINWETGEILIDKQLNRQKGNILVRELKGTKTHRARTIIVPRFVIDILRIQNIKQKEWKLRAGQHWKNQDKLVFTREDGSPIPHNSVANSFKRIVSRIGMPNLSFHSLRHTFITDELRSGTDVKTTAELAGHATTTITLDVYAAATNEMKQAAAQRRQQIYEQKNA